MSAPVSFSRRAIAISGGPAAGRHPLFAGAMHYFRVEPRRWSRCLAAMRSIGFTFVDTPVPWSVHERGPGRFDFSGGRDLGAFLDACAGEGLGVLLRIGPRVGAELTAGGIPERVLGDGSMLQRNSAGAPVYTLEPPRGWPAPSYASPRFLEETGALYRALGEVIAPRLAPAGPVALLQLDHELGGFLRAGPWCGDYHPAIVARFAAEHGGAEPPRKPPRTTPERSDLEAADLAPLLAWMAFRERLVTSALVSLSSLADEAGLSRSVPGAAAGALRLHGFAALPPVLYDVVAAERVIDVATIAVLDAAGEHARTAARARYLAGSSRFPLVAPLALGTSAWGPPRRSDDGVAALLGALMHGAAGYSASMAVARDRWIGAAIDDSGHAVRALAEPLRRIHAALAAAGWVDLERPADLGLLVPRDYLRLDLASSHLGPLAPLAEWLRMGRAGARTDHFGFEGPVQREHHEVAAALVAAMQHAGLPFVIVDSSAGLEALRGLRALVVPTFEFLDGELAARLRTFAEAGGRILSGPRVPRLDAAMQQADVTLPGARFDAAALADPAALGAALARLVNYGGTGAAYVRRPAAHLSDGSHAAATLSVHQRSDGTPALLFVGPSPASEAGPAPRGVRAGSPRPGARGALARIEGAGGDPFVDVITGERFHGDTLEVPLGPAVRLLAPEDALGRAAGGRDHPHSPVRSS